MKIKCMKSNFLKGLNIVSKAVPSKTTMSILQCILIDSTRGNIRLITNDTELGIETVIEGEIIEKGVVAIDAKIITDIVRKLPESEVLLQTDSSYKTNITCANSRFDILGKSGDEFAYLPDITRDDYISISQFSLKDVIRQTSFSVAVNDNNKIMTGELFEIRDDKLRVVSLDGHRISIRNLELKEKSENRKVIIPGRALNEISKILTGDADSIVNIYFSDKNIVFEFDDSILLSRVIDGDYFNVDQMLSNEYSTKVTVNKREFMDCIDRSTILVKEGDKKPIIIDINDNYMDIRINSTLGSLNDSIDISKDGNDITIGFNPKFLIDVLRVIDDDEVDIYLQSPKSPCIIKDEELSYIYLVLPVNINTVN